jgi:hypothetical protein
LYGSGSGYWDWKCGDYGIGSKLGGSDEDEQW